MSSVNNTKRSENRNDVIRAARNRWKVLAQSLVSKTRRPNHQSKPTSHEQNSKTVCFHTFDLITFTPLTNTSAIDFECTSTIERNRLTFSVRVQIPKRRFTLAEISGFNNTGNICVWPTEEVMTFYALNNLQLFHGKRVLELGGGMTCLAGLMLAKYSSANRVHLTDGNATSIENVKTLIKINDFDDEKVICSVLEWGSVSLVKLGTFDIILCADCLFFEEARNDLVQAMWTLLRDDGLVIVMAPLRGDTFDKFRTLAEATGFHCTMRENYNQHVWRQHLAFEGKPEYEPNKHYPLLLQLTKKSNAIRSIHYLTTGTLLGS